MYLGNDAVSSIGNLNTPVTAGAGGPLPAVGANNNIIDVLNDLGQAAEPLPGRV